MPKLKKYSLDPALEILGVIAIIISFTLPAFYYQDLPDSLPRHFGSDGLPDAYGGKGMIWVLPIVGFFMYLILRFISTLPELINLPFKVNPTESESQKRKYGRMIRVLNVGMIWIFAFLTQNTIQIGLGNQTQLSSFFTPISLVFFIGIPLIFILPDFLKSKK